VTKEEAYIRTFDSRDIPELTGAFEAIGWNKPASQYERYLIEQVYKVRDVYIARVKDQLAGYLTICWESTYEPFRARHIPEITDFNVLPGFRRMGIGTQLMDRAEAEIARVSPAAGIGVGMTPDYGAAQRLYILRGYVPDGNGLHHFGRPIHHGQVITVDDTLALYLVKELK
jgi:GNAT superfamily N-acetyltransferase